MGYCSTCRRHPPGPYRDVGSGGREPKHSRSSGWPTSWGSGNRERTGRTVRSAKALHGRDDRGRNRNARTRKPTGLKAGRRGRTGEVGPGRTNTTRGHRTAETAQGLERPSETTVHQGSITQTDSHPPPRRSAPRCKDGRRDEGTVSAQEATRSPVVGPTAGMQVAKRAARGWLERYRCRIRRGGDIPVTLQGYMLCGHSGHHPQTRSAKPPGTFANMSNRPPPTTA
jgi:hypothetical protein